MFYTKNQQGGNNIFKISYLKLITTITNPANFSDSNKRVSSYEKTTVGTLTTCHHSRKESKVQRERERERERENTERKGEIPGIPGIQNQ